MVTLRPEDKLYTEELLDSVVSTIIPDEEEESKMFMLVEKHFLHRSFRPDNYADAQCMKDRKCSKYYPKAFCNNTILIVNYPLRQSKYRKPNDKKVIDFNSFAINNNHVVPHNK